MNKLGDDSALRILVHYARLPDEELLLIAADRDHLVSEAARALDAEMATRGLSFKQAGELKDSAARNEARDRVGKIGLSFRGWGKQFIGAANYAPNQAQGFEEFDSTLWLFALYLPVIPLATIRVRPPFKGQTVFWSFEDREFSPVETRPLKMIYVLATYAATALLAFVAFQFLRISLNLASRFLK